MFIPMQYRAKAAEAAESLKNPENPRDIRKLQQSKRTFSTLADNEDWLKDNYDRMVHPVELPAPYGRPKPSAIPSSDAASEEQILRCLGAAVIMSWSTIPTKLQRELFDTAGSMGDLLSSVELRGQIARFLHKQKRHEGYAAGDHNAGLTERPFNA